MGKFVRKFLLYASPFLVLLVFVVFYRTKADERELQAAYSGELSSYAWASNCGPVHGIILGSSTLRYGLSSNGISDPGKQWINFSYDARDPVVMYLLLKSYYPVLKPASVIVGLDPWIYTRRYYIYRSKMMYLDLNGMDLLRFLHADANGLIKKAQLMVELACGKFNKVPAINNKVPIPPDFGSYKLNQSALNFDANEDWFETGWTGWSDIQFSYLTKIDQFCKEHGINVVYVFPPKRADYILAAKTRFKEENEQWWIKMNEAIPEARVLGSFDDLKGCDQGSVFAEAYHLNASGQEKYSAFIKEHLGDAQPISPRYQYISPDKF